MSEKNNPNPSHSTPSSHENRASRLYSSAQSHILRDGLDFVLDPVKSLGAEVVNELDGKTYLNFHGGYRSNALGENHPGFTQQDIEKIARATINKQAHADIYTADQLQAIQTISDLYMLPAGFKKAFFIDGGALAVENAIKVAIRNHALQQNVNEPETGLVIGMEGAFHGRSGITMSLSRTDPAKSEFMPKFNWPALTPPYSTEETNSAIAQLDQLIKAYPGKIAAIVIEPIQCEGGDRRIPKAYFEALSQRANQEGFYLIYDETQTGFFVTGQPFAFQTLGLPKPDLVCGAKKSSIGYVFAAERILAVSGNAFEQSSKINSTWGGHGGDYLVCARKLELIQQNNLQQHITQMGALLLAGLETLSKQFSQLIHAPRGVGLLVSADCPSAELRDAIIANCFKERLLLLSGGIPNRGPYTLRFGPPLTITEDQINEGLETFKAALTATAAQ